MSKSNWLLLIGKAFTDFLLLTLLLLASAATLVAFPLCYSAAVSYFSKGFKERSIKDFFSFIKDNSPVIWQYDAVAVALLIGPIINSVYLKNHLNMATYGLFALGYISLFIDLIIMGYAPLVMMKMKVTLKQLITNCFGMLFGKWYYTLILVCSLAVYAYFSMLYPWFTFIGIYFMAMANFYLANESFKGVLKKCHRKSSDQDYLGGNQL